MDMLAAMRVFQRVAMTLSFTEAAERLGLAPSSVSRQIDLLEAQLGVKLLTRTTRKLSLTEPGELYKSRVDALLAEFDAVHDSVATFASEPRGRLRVSVPRVFGKRVLSPLLPAFLKAHPKMSVELSLTDDYADLVETDIDLAIRIGTLGDSTLISRPLGRYRRVLCCHPSYLRTRAQPTEPADLALHNCLRYRQSGERVVWAFSHRDRDVAIEIAPHGDLSANDVEVLLGAAQAGGGIALLPHWLVGDAIDRGELVQLLPDYPLAGGRQAAGIHFVYAINRRQSRKVRAFMAYVLDQAGHLFA
ncbi:LysR family transcriptional regulator [Ralstonia sp. ASV6]|uniref:LysR family transcriptional regulator n=1 Tax=Ralstonia sp. ASV6 TaxID=2795124 RepID=UPI0018EB139A|nr:LysR family transcriptional regulator [Ralstonia sp. ASV6]